MPDAAGPPPGPEPDIEGHPLDVAEEPAGGGESSEDEASDEAEEPLDPTDVLGGLAGLLGAMSAIDVGDVRVWGQNATGPGAMSIGTLHLTTGGSAKDDGRFWSELLSATHLREVAGFYADALSDQRLDRQLTQRHVVCLSGPVGTGRFTSACLASVRRHGIDRVGVLAAEHLVDLLRPGADLRGETGYVLRLTDEDVQALDGFTLLALAGRAESTGATLILVGDFSRCEKELVGHVVEHRPAPATDVFRSRLGRELAGRCAGWCAVGCDGGCVDRYLDECAGHPLLTGYLAGEPRPAEVARLVEAIARTTPRAAALTERLAQLLPRQLRERAAQILELDSDSVELPPGWSAERARAFRLSCAVLAGQPIAEIDQAAQRLAGQLPEETPAPVTCLRRVALDGVLGPTLRAAVLVPDDERSVSGQRIDFVPGGEQLRPVLLDVAWTEWWLPRTLLDWLAGLVRGDAAAVRQAAAGAIGWSAGRDVRMALETVQDLARERRAGVRQAAAIVLVAMGMQPRLQQRVRTELEYWAAGSAAHLRDTVARAYGLGLARLWPDAALAHLRLVAQARMQRRNNSVVRGLVEVYQAGHAADLIPELVGWSGSTDPEVRLHAGRALRVLADRWSPPPRDQWPELLDLARAGAIARDDLAALWACALSLPSTAYRSWRTLGFWVNRAEGQPEVAAHLLELLRVVIAGRPPLRHRLDHQVRHVWHPVMPRTELLRDVSRLINEEG